MLFGKPGGRRVPGSEGDGISRRAMFDLRSDIAVRESSGSGGWAFDGVMHIKNLATNFVKRDGDGRGGKDGVLTMESAEASPSEVIDWLSSRREKRGKVSVWVPVRVCVVDPCSDGGGECLGACCRRCDSPMSSATWVFAVRWSDGSGWCAAG